MVLKSSRGYQDIDIDSQPAEPMRIQGHGACDRVGNADRIEPCSDLAQRLENGVLALKMTIAFIHAQLRIRVLSVLVIDRHTPAVGGSRSGPIEQLCPVGAVGANRVSGCRA